ncbi:MAG: GntR family transcriptional regulator [Deltaproteobacteria bacterium]|nr:GntR family transcriptional regulator [Deltaproteobacteria bacterium]
MSGRGVVPFRPPLRRRVHEAVAEQLRDAILDGRYAAGQKLPPERELAAEFQVNRTSLREAIKVLEGLGLVTVRQGDGATVQPLTDASLSILPFVIHRGGRTDRQALADVTEVLTPLFYEMARLAVARHTPAQLAALRDLRAAVADDRAEREMRFEAGRQLLELISDMTGNRVWQMLARKTVAFLRSEPMRQARQDLRRDPGAVVPTIDRCLTALDRGHPEDALAALRDYMDAMGAAVLSLRGAGRKRAAS